MSTPGNRPPTTIVRRGGSASGSKKPIGASDIPAFLAPGTDVSAKFKGAFCEAKIQGFESESLEIRADTKLSSVPIDHIYYREDVQGKLELGKTVMVSYENQFYEGIITHIRDLSKYKIIFNDGDEKVLRRNQMVLKGEKHYDTQSNLDNMPLLNPNASRHKRVINETLLGSSRSCTRQIQAFVDSGKKEAQSESISTWSSLSDLSDSSGDEKMSTSKKNRLTASKPDDRRLDEEQKSRLIKSETEANSTAAKKRRSGALRSVSPTIEFADGSAVMVQTTNEKGKPIFYFGIIAAHTAYVSNTTDKTRVFGHNEYPIRCVPSGDYRIFKAQQLNRYDETKTLPESLNSKSKEAAEIITQYKNKGRLPNGWSTESIFGLKEVESGRSNKTKNRKKTRNTQRREKFYKQLDLYYKSMDIKMPNRLKPVYNGKELDMCRLFSTVGRDGGYRKVSKESKWSTILENLKWGSYMNAEELRDLYHSRLETFEYFQNRMKDQSKNKTEQPNQQPTSDASSPAPSNVDERSSVSSKSEKKKIIRKPKKTSELDDTSGTSGPSVSKSGTPSHFERRQKTVSEALSEDTYSERAAESEINDGDSSIDGESDQYEYDASEDEEEIEQNEINVVRATARSPTDLDANDGFVAADILSPLSLNKVVRAAHHTRFYSGRILKACRANTKVILRVLTKLAPIVGTAKKFRFTTRLHRDALNELGRQTAVKVHYCGWNSRHDDWVALDQIKVSLETKRQAMLSFIRNYNFPANLLEVIYAFYRRRRITSKKYMTKKRANRRAVVRGKPLKYLELVDSPDEVQLYPELERFLYDDENYDVPEPMDENFEKDEYDRLSNDQLANVNTYIPDVDCSHDHMTSPIHDVAGSPATSSSGFRTSTRGRKRLMEPTDTQVNSAVTENSESTKTETEEQTSKTEAKRRKKLIEGTSKSTVKQQAIAVVRPMQMSSNLQCSSPVQSTSTFQSSSQSIVPKSSADANRLVGPQSKIAKPKTVHREKSRSVKEKTEKRPYTSTSGFTSTETSIDVSPAKQMRVNPLTCDPSVENVDDLSIDTPTTSTAISSKTSDVVRSSETLLTETISEPKHSPKIEVIHDKKLKRQSSQPRNHTPSTESSKIRRKSTQLQIATHSRSSSPRSSTSTTQLVFVDKADAKTTANKPSSFISTTHEISTDALLETEQIKTETNTANEIEDSSDSLQSMNVNAVVLQPKLTHPIESSELTVDVESFKEENFAPSALSEAARELHSDHSDVSDDAVLLAITNQVQGDELINTFEEDDTNPETNFLPTQRQLSSIDLNRLQLSISNCRAIMKPLNVKIDPNMQQSFFASSSSLVQQTALTSDLTSLTPNLFNAQGSMSAAKSQPFIPLHSPNNSLGINLPALSPNTKLRRSPAQQTLQAVLNQPSQSSKFTSSHSDDQQTRLLQCLQSQQHSPTLRSPFDTTSKFHNGTRLPAMLTSISHQLQSSVSPSAEMNTFPANAGRSTQEICLMDNVPSQNPLHVNNVLFNSSIHSMLYPRHSLQFAQAFQEHSLYNMNPNFSLAAANRLFNWKNEAQNQWLTIAECKVLVSKNNQAASAEVVLPTSQNIRLVGALTDEPCEDCGANPSTVEVHLLNTLPSYFRTEVLDTYARTHRMSKDRKNRPQCNLKGLSKQAQRQAVEKRRHEDRMEELRKSNGREFLMIDSKFSQCRRANKPPLLVEIMTSIGYDSADANRLAESKEICSTTEQEIDDMDSREVRSNVIKLIEEKSPDKDALSVIDTQNVDQLREYINRMALIAERENVRLVMANHNLEMTDEFEELLKSTQECIVNEQSDFEAEEERLIRRAAILNRNRPKYLAQRQRKGYY
ncbi:ARID/BRIGHT DNA binding domain protein [Aphelenchoides besseyi]|nr:ARID/BRIGHT DNA binding domain protein [Aphelenchoides besseyi]